MGSGERSASLRTHRRGAASASGRFPISQVKRTEGRQVVHERPAALFFGRETGKAGTGNSSHGIAHTALRHPRRGRRPHRRLRRLGHARQLRFADRGAPRRAPRRRHVRRLAHVRRRPARRPRARLPAPPARQRRRQADAARQGAVLVHAARARRRDRRPDRLLHGRPVVPHGRQRRHARQGPRVAAPAWPPATAWPSSRAPISR